MPAKRKRKAADGDDDKQAWRVGAPSEHMNPQPAVQMITRNLRSEFPKSFMRKL